MTTPRHWLLPLLALLLAAPAHAQFAPGGPDDPDTPIDAATRAAVVESLAVQVQRHYIFAEKGAELARALRKRAAGKQYDRITSSKELADTLTAHMQATTHDLHMRVHYRHEPLPVLTPQEPSADEIRMQTEFERLRNFGFESVQRLPGNVGLLDLRSFSSLPEAQAQATIAMNFLGNCDALIVDLRRNGGGDPAMIATLLSYLVAPGERLLFNTFEQRGETTLRQFYTSPYVPGPRLNGKPVYVLTSPFTGSAAEEFSYDIQTHRLGRTVGGTTAGAANPGGMHRLSEHLAAFIADGRAVNPITKTNWEGVGVRPDVAVPPHTALREALVLAIQDLLQKPRSDEHKAFLQRALNAAKQRADDPASDYERPRRRS